MSNSAELKKQAAEKAVDYVKSGMVLGLGTGSTTEFALHKIAKLLQGGTLSNIVGIPSSERTAKLSEELNIPLTTFEKNTVIDLTIDGADEVDQDLNLIKGGGGALLREKVLAQASKEEIIIVDKSKISTNLGESWAVPIEVIKFATPLEIEFLKSIGGKPILRMNDDKPFLTDEGNYILDTNFGVIKNAPELAEQLEARAGIVEHGLFINLANYCIVAKENQIEVLTK